MQSTRSINGCLSSFAFFDTGKFIFIYYRMKLDRNV